VEPPNQVCAAAPRRSLDSHEGRCLADQSHGHSSGKLSLSTSGSGAGASQPDSASAAARNASFAKRFGGDTSSHGTKSNHFNSATTPGGSLVSPGPASSAFGLGSGAFASFGSAKTPKSPGNPFDFALKSATEKNPAVPKLPVGLSGPTAASEISGVAGADGKALHPLRDEWVFWFRPPISKANGYIEYEKTLHPICTVGTVEDFFGVYAHLKRPSALPLVSDYHLFKKGVRPIWEDDENKRGGKWIVRLRKGVADRYWEDLLLAIIGDQFAEASEEVCGAVLSVRNGEDILSVWARADGGRVLKIRYVPHPRSHIPPSPAANMTSFAKQRDHEARPRLPARHQGRVEEPRLVNPATHRHRGVAPRQDRQPQVAAARPRTVLVSHRRARRRQAGRHRCPRRVVGDARAHVPPDRRTRLLPWLPRQLARVRHSRHSSDRRVVLIQ